MDIGIYCVKCKAKTDSQDVQETVMKNGRPAVQSVCADCGTRKFRIGALSESERQKVASCVTS